MARSQLIGSWKQAFWYLSLEAKVPKGLDHISVVAIHHFKANEPDPGACMPAVKAAIDGVVKAKVVPDDQGRFVSPIIFTAPIRGPEDGLELIIFEGEIDATVTTRRPTGPVPSRKRKTVRADRLPVATQA